MDRSSDFTSEVLRINGLLQASITELRYRCEVYRLSLKSICKTLENVHKEQEVRVRCLTTTRPSYQAYLLNLSQKQALDRIGNVVKKASTFINGYSLVDKRLFLPPPPKPGSIERNKKKVSPSTPASQVVGNECTTEQSLDKPNANTEMENGTPSASPENRKWELAEGSAKNKRTSRTSSKRKSGEKREKERKKAKLLENSTSHKVKKRSHKRDGRIRNSSKPRSEKGKEVSSKKSLRFSLEVDREEGKQEKLSSKSITCHRSQVINPRARFQDNLANRRIFSAEPRRVSLEQSQSGETGNASERKSFLSHINKNTSRAEVTAMPSKDQNVNRSGNSNHKVENLNGRKSSSQLPSLKAIQGNKSATEATRYKVRESLALVRHHHRPTNSAGSQGQGVPRKCLVSAYQQQRQTNFKLNFVTVEDVRRAILKKMLDANGKTNRSILTSTRRECKDKSGFVAPKNLSFSK